MFGQCQGGNAKLWFDLFNRNLVKFKEIQELIYICRNPISFNNNNFKIINLYGEKTGNNLFNKFKMKFISDYYSKYFFKRFFKKNSFDILHIQGNYSPKLNSELINSTSAKVVLNIYGSDFYQKYLKSKNKIFKNEFKEVLQKADCITCNWITTLEDVQKEFPEYRNKLRCIVWGVDEKWMVNHIKKKSDKEIVFLSTRGLYSYNNIDILVEAFCEVFANNNKYKLYIINGYGNDIEVIKKVNNIVSKYSAKNVILKINEWISEEELMEIYEKAHYNFCIGSTDQLTISIIYAFLKEVKNILSPLQNYYDLQTQGYKSMDILSGISKKSLVDYFRNIIVRDENAISQDKIKASKEFIFSKNFNRYIKLYQNIILS